jgi:hypothetical protein
VGGPAVASPFSRTRYHRARQNEENLRFGDLWQDHDLVFPNRVVKPLDHNNHYYREYKPLLRKAGLAGYRAVPHADRERLSYL